MKIRNISKTVVFVAGLSVAPRRVAEIVDEDWQSWLRAGSANQETAQTKIAIIGESGNGLDGAEAEVKPSLTHEQKIGEIIDTIKSLDPDDDAAWLKSGKPNPARLKSLVGYDVTAAERDEAWDAVQSQDAGSELPGLSDDSGDDRVSGRDAKPF